MTTRTSSAINTIRTLSMDGVQKANSGHPGAPMALAPVAYQLYAHDDEAQPGEPGLVRPRPLRALRRPRLDAPLLDPAPVRLRRSRWTTSRTSASSAAPPPATPSTRPTAPRASRSPPGRSGQGISNAVGLALAERMLAARFNRDGHEMIDHHTYTIASDGDMQEGVASEACSLAGPPRPRPPDRLLRRQPDPARRPDRDGASARTSARASRPTAGTCRTWARTSRRRASQGAIEAAKAARTAGRR